MSNWKIYVRATRQGGWPVEIIYDIEAPTIMRAIQVVEQKHLMTFRTFLKGQAHIYKVEEENEN